MKASVRYSPIATGEEFAPVAALLGGDAVLRHSLSNALDAHDMLSEGLSSRALRHLIENLEVISTTDSLEKAVGMSLRTFQRRKDAPNEPLSPEQSGRTWKFAEILARATAIMGTQSAAEHWLERPAMGLDGRTPISLLASPAGVSMVENLLGRIEYGVYT